MHFPAELVFIRLPRTISIENKKQRSLSVLHIFSRKILYNLLGVTFANSLFLISREESVSNKRKRKTYTQPTTFD